VNKKILILLLLVANFINVSAQIANEFQNKITFTVKGVSFDMIKVEAGTFDMGATSEQQDPWDCEKPVHKVTLTRDYYIGKTEVTQALWKAVMGHNPSHFKGDDKPVEDVPWDDCQQFVNKLNSLTGKNFRLPTEAEWEFAARGGNNSNHYQYSGSNNLRDVAWYDHNSNGTTHDVATKLPNELGIYDMSGNVYEWCSDWYGDYSSNAQYDPAGSSRGSYRVCRGGSWNFDARFCRSLHRIYSSPDRCRNLGMRLVISETANPSDLAEKPVRDVASTESNVAKTSKKKVKYRVDVAFFDTDPSSLPKQPASDFELKESNVAKISQNNVTSRVGGASFGTAKVEVGTQQRATSQYLIFNVTPTDAIVEVNGKTWTTTGGRARKVVPLGNYSYTVRANNYHTQTGTVAVNDPNNKVVVNVSLKSAYGSVNISSIGNLTGGIVYIDDKIIGPIPCTAKKVPSGTHQVRITKTMYKTLEKEIVVKDGETTEFSPTLLENFATVTLSVANNAQIFVNDKLKGNGTWTGKLEYGENSIKTQKAGHRSQTNVYSISAASDKQTITLTPPTPMYGRLDIDVQPDESEVYLDGVKVGTTPLFLQNVLVGNHKLEIKNKGCLSYTDNIAIQENATYKLENIRLNKKLTFTVKGVSFDMMKVEAGTFNMGATSELDPYSDEEMPVHEVTLSRNYYIGKTEVTQALWIAVMGSNPSNRKGGNKPVESVSWNDCQTFISRLNAATGKKFRLPTEAEWEFAARGGNYSNHYQYSGSNDLDDVAWYDDNSNNTTHDVATKKPNELCIYDMSGNVYEWCSDWMGRYGSNAQYDPVGPSSGSYRVYRGGCWYHYTRNCRSSSRDGFYPDYRSNYGDVGLRLALSDTGGRAEYTRQIKKQQSFKTRKRQVK
jgi:formylglycine-generating enzyme required for sulfatase activity